jgi:hypothetical protein
MEMDQGVLELAEVEQSLRLDEDGFDVPLVLAQNDLRGL